MNKLKEILMQQARETKYRSQKITVDGITFDSVKEANRWQELRMLERAGEIRDLQRQVPFVVIPTQRDENGKLIEKEVRYVADFTYIEKGKLTRTVEDVKSEATMTREYIIKRKLMLYRNGIRIREV
jgi:dsDNA-binding SOS-regulon protein